MLTCVVCIDVLLPVFEFVRTRWFGWFGLFKRSLLECLCLGLCDSFVWTCWVAYVFYLFLVWVVWVCCLLFVICLVIGGWILSPMLWLFVLGYFFGGCWLCLIFGGWVVVLFWFWVVWVSCCFVFGGLGWL